MLHHGVLWQSMVSEVQEDQKNTRLSIHLQEPPKLVFFKKIVGFHPMFIVHGFLIDACSLKICTSECKLYYTVAMLLSYAGVTLCRKQSGQQCLLKANTMLYLSNEHQPCFIVHKEHYSSPQKEKKSQIAQTGKIRQCTGLLLKYLRCPSQPLNSKQT